MGFLYADQTYLMTGQSGKPARVQYVDGENLPVRIHRETVLNSVSIPVPSAVLPQLDANALADISENGVYKQPFNVVLQPLQESTVRSDLTKFLTGVLSLVEAGANEHSCSLESMQPEWIADAIAGRPNVDPGGPSYFNINSTIRDCSTQSYEHGFKIIDLAHKLFGKLPVIRVGGDGQLVLLLSYLKRRFPRRYAHTKHICTHVHTRVCAHTHKHLHTHICTHKHTRTHRFKHILIDSGDFHMFAHLLFAFIELFWKCCVKCFVKVLEIDKRSRRRLSGGSGVVGVVGVGGGVGVGGRVGGGGL